MTSIVMEVGRMWINNLKEQCFDAISWVTGRGPSLCPLCNKILIWTSWRLKAEEELANRDSPEKWLLKQSKGGVGEVVYLVHGGWYWKPFSRFELSECSLVIITQGIVCGRWSLSCMMVCTVTWRPASKNCVGAAPRWRSCWHGNRSSMRRRRR